jgi:glycosyltransferase involved in cell wall biosynthesis
LEYIEHLTVLCPVHKEKPPLDMVQVDLDHAFGRLQILGVPPSDSTWKAILRSFVDFRSVYRAVAEAQIVHGGAIGWPIPLGYYAFLAAKILRRFHVNVMESSPWRLLPNRKYSFADRVRGFLMEFAAQGIARKSQLSLFTSEAYRKSMVAEGFARAHVFKAAWVTRDRVISRNELDRRLRAKDNGTLVVGFAGRLVHEKGIETLLEALRRMEPSVSISARVLGDGPLAAEVRQLASSANSNVFVRLLGVIDYGEQFFRELDDWDVAVVPSFSLEQPRIVYDAFARGVPIISSDTRALRECVRDGKDGLLFPVGDAEALVHLLAKIAHDRPLLARLAFQALETAAEHTHERMHENRAALIQEAWQTWGTRRG